MVIVTFFLLRTKEISSANFILIIILFFYFSLCAVCETAVIITKWTTIFVLDEKLSVILFSEL